MNLPVTRKVVEDVLREAHENGRLSRGRWSEDPRDGQPFRGCAVGNLLWQASGGTAERRDISHAAWNAVGLRNVDSSSYGEVREYVREGSWLSVVSVVHERRYRDTDESLEAVIRDLRKFLPERFTIDIDGLRALPTWKPTWKRKAKRKVKARRKS